jgi:hypothetical protein
MPKTKLTVDMVNERVAQISRKVKDPEDAHSAEDGLYLEVLRAIAGMRGPAARLAKAALATTKIRFPRWCA